jgi:hypothetical protein
MSLVRYLMVLSLVVWLGGLIFFPVVAQTAFSILPSRHLAGILVGRSLGTLHRMGIVSGMIFLASSMVYSRWTKGAPQMFAARHLLICLMLALTLISQVGIIPRMDLLRASIGEIDSVPRDNPARLQFDRLHVWSTRVESGVILLGLVVVYLTASALSV